MPARGTASTWAQSETFGLLEAEVEFTALDDPRATRWAQAHDHAVERSRAHLAGLFPSCDLRALAAGSHPPHHATLTTPLPTISVEDVVALARTRPARIIHPCRCDDVTDDDDPTALLAALSDGMTLEVNVAPSDRADALEPFQRIAEHLERALAVDITMVVRAASGTAIGDDGRTTRCDRILIQVTGQSRARIAKVAGAPALHTGSVVVVPALRTLTRVPRDEDHVWIELQIPRLETIDPHELRRQAARRPGRAAPEQHRPHDSRSSGYEIRTTAPGGFWLLARGSIGAGTMNGVGIAGHGFDADDQLLAVVETLGDGEWHDESALGLDYAGIHDFVALLLTIDAVDRRPITVGETNGPLTGT